MKNIENVIEFSELLSYSQGDLGIFWNEAHEILVNDNVPPIESSGIRYWHVDELDEDEYDLSDKSKGILVGFMKKNEVDFINIVKSFY